VAEAGTGTGKTFAYLVPALLSGGKVIVSTGTKTLQDQLFNRDLPTVRDALKVPARRSRCSRGAPTTSAPTTWSATCRPTGAGLARGSRAPAQDRALRRAIRKTGDKAECIDVPEDSAAWAWCHLDPRQLPRPGMPESQGLLRAGGAADALAADVVVVNHHLFFADVMLKDEGMGELLPACNAVIFDEAHQLPEVASLFFGESVSTTQIIELARDTRSEGIAAAKDYPPLQATAQPGKAAATCAWR
jgi:ATP-dependent DNA helicase DinG